jgi:hypothetical protein
MIRIETVGIDGKKIIELIPETVEDEKLLEQMATDGELDNRDSFADDPGVWFNPKDNKTSNG